MDKKISTSRNRSKSVVTRNQRSNSLAPFSQPGIDAIEILARLQEKNNDLGTGDSRKKRHSEAGDLIHTFNKFSVFQSNNPKHEGLSALPDKERLTQHRLSLDVHRQIPPKQESDETVTYKKSRHNSVFGSLQPLTSFSFHKKNVFDLEKTKTKALDPKKDFTSRIRHLKVLADKCSFQELDEFYKKYHNFIFHTIHECLKSTDLTIKSGTASSKLLEAKELAIGILEGLFCSIPHLINKKHQYHSTVAIVRQMLQADTSSKTFSDGMKLFVLWYSILMENADDNEHMLFAKLLMRADGFGTYNVLVFHNLLKFIVTEIKKVQWDEQSASYNFVLRRLEACHLRKIYPYFQPIDYTTFQYESFGNVEIQTESGLLKHQRVVIDWLSAIIGSNKRAHSMSRDKFGVMMEALIEKLDAESSGECETNSRDEHIDMSQQTSPSSILATRQEGREEFNFTVDERMAMKKFLFSNKCSVNMVLEIFNQAFKGTFGRSSLVKDVCLVYKIWLKGQQTPAFLRENNPKSPTASSSARFSNPKGRDDDDADNYWIEPQRFIQIFISQSCVIFFCDWKSMDGSDKNLNLLKSFQDQINVCGHVLNLYRYLIMDVRMEATTWTCLLEKMIKICNHVVVPPSSEFGAMEELRKKLIESLLVAFVRASINGHVTRKLWERMNISMMSLMGVDMVVQQWGSIMVMLTKMLGSSLYNIDLVSPGDDSRRPRKKLKNSRTKGIMFQSESFSQEEENVKAKDSEKESNPGDSFNSVTAPSLETSKDHNSGSRRTFNGSNSSESSNPPAEKILDSSFSIGDASSDLNEMDGDQSVGTVDDPSIVDSADSVKESSMAQSESSGSFENSLSAGLCDQKESEDDTSSSVQTALVNNESLDRSSDKELVRGASLDDGQVEMDLTEVKECCLGDEGLRTIWLKMLGIFGNVANDHHYIITDNLKLVHDCMLKIYKHHDFVNDGKLPILILVPWLLQIIHAPKQLLQNKLMAYSMICDYMLHVSLPSDYLSRFYFSIHVGLQSSVKDISHAIIRLFSKQIFGHHLGRGIILLEDFLHVALNITCNGEELAKSQIPDKVEASRLLASVVNIPNYCQNLDVLDHNSFDIQLKTFDSDHLKNVVINSLINSIVDVQKNSGVCSISICGVGIYLHEEILSHPNHPLVPRVIKCLLSIFSKSASPNYSNIDKLLASQALFVLKDHHHHLLQNNFRGILWFIIENLLGYVHHSIELRSLSKEFKIIHSILYNILDWFLVLPVSFLLDQSKGISLLDLYFKVLIKANNICVSDAAKSMDGINLTILQLKLLINFVYCHLVNNIGCHYEAEDSHENDSQSWQLMAWFGTRIFETLQSPNKNYQTDQTPAASLDFSLRDVTGKWRWNIRSIDASPSNKVPANPRRHVKTDRMQKSILDLKDGIDEDIIIKALNLIADTSPECFPSIEHQSLTIPYPCLQIDPIQDSLINPFVQQEEQICKFVNDCKENFTSCERLELYLTLFNSALLSKMFQSFGFLQLQDRKGLNFLKNGDQLMREIKHFDAQRCLETHKVAVFYVGPNQTCKTEILLNQKGSHLFEEFYLKLGDLVQLKHHKGFLGGLSTNGSTGEKAPYYSPSSLLQVIFHVSTLLTPSHVEANDEDVCVTKMRHLGNDEVHIVWMENRKTYTTDLIPTKFGEVTIVIYPLPRLLFRIQIIKKIMMDMFGPLFDGSIVGWSNLAALVRATVINAGRAIRETRDFYQKFYEERYSSLKKMVNMHKEQSTYEQFLYSSVAPGVKVLDPLSFVAMETQTNADQLPQPPVKPERRNRMDIYPNRKQRSELLVPLKAKSEKRNQDVK